MVSPDFDNKVVIMRLVKLSERAWVDPNSITSVETRQHSPDHFILTVWVGEHCVLEEHLKPDIAKKRAEEYATLAGS